MLFPTCRFLPSSSSSFSPSYVVRTVLLQAFFFYTTTTSYSYFRNPPPPPSLNPTCQPRPRPRPRSRPRSRFPPSRSPHRNSSSPPHVNGFNLQYFPTSVKDLTLKLSTLLQRPPTPHTREVLEWNHTLRHLHVRLTRTNSAMASPRTNEILPWTIFLISRAPATCQSTPEFPVLTRLLAAKLLELVGEESLYGIGISLCVLGFSRLGLTVDEDDLGVWELLKKVTLRELQAPPENSLGDEEVLSFTFLAWCVYGFAQVGVSNPTLWQALAHATISKFKSQGRGESRGSEANSVDLTMLVSGFTRAGVTDDIDLWQVLVNVGITICRQHTLSATQLSYLLEGYSLILTSPSKTEIAVEENQKRVLVNTLVSRAKDGCEKMTPGEVQRCIRSCLRLNIQDEEVWENLLHHAKEKE